MRQLSVIALLGCIIVLPASIAKIKNAKSSSWNIAKLT